MAIIAYNFVTGEELTFDDATAPEWACAYGYCQEHNLISWLLTMCLSKDMARAYAELPFTFGTQSIACGDWAARIQ